MIPSRVQELRQQWIHRLWDPDALAGGGFRAAVLRTLRILHCIVRDLAEGQLTLRAMSLVYTTLLSLVPLLAVSFSVLKAFGVHNQAQPLLARLLQPLGERGAQLTEQIVSWVDNMRVGVLGGVGVAFLIFTVLTLIQKIEGAFNYSWHVSRKRNLSKRFGDFLSILLVGPVLVFAGLGVTVQVMNTRLVAGLLSIQPLGALVQFASQLVPFVLAIAAFTFFYVFVPNTKVKLRSAFVGATLAGLAWQFLGWIFGSFVIHAPTFAGIFSGFAIVLLFMIWIYLSWLILLVGASIAFYHQQPEYLGLDRGDVRLSARMRERLALQVMFLIARRHYEESEAAWSIDALAQRLRLPVDAVGRVLDTLEAEGVLAVSGDHDDRYLPAKALETLELTEILDAVRTGEETTLLNVGRLPAEPAVDSIAAQVDAAVAGVLGQITIRDLVHGEAEPAEPCAEPDEPASPASATAPAAEPPTAPEA